jgi:hypothetical protein
MKWVKKWGFGPVAYLFDYIDPSFKQDFITECNNIISDISKFKRADSDDYQDAFKMSFIAPKNNKLKNDEDFKAINPNFSKAVYDIGINTCQLNNAINDWGWFLQEGSNDQAYDFVLKYDQNGDGRLDISELILGVIWNNRKRDGLICYDCFYLLAKKLGAMFTYLDCQNKGYLTTEELWNKLPNLVRGTTKWNIFALSNSDTIRTSSVNDFLLKSSFTIDAGITKNEFISGILLGLWQRNTTPLKVLSNSDESKSMKSFRWTTNDTVDLIASNYLAENAPLS